MGQRPATRLLNSMGRPWPTSSWLVGKYPVRVLALVAGFDENLGCERFGWGLAHVVGGATIA